MSTSLVNDLITVSTHSSDLLLCRCYTYNEHIDVELSIIFLQIGLRAGLGSVMGGITHRVRGRGWVRGRVAVHVKDS